MKKGFTLIELLAVIVILAIIALIATPIVLNIINETKESATLRSAEFYMDAVENAIAMGILNHQTLDDGTYNITKDGDICLENFDSINKTCPQTNTLAVEVSGEKPSGGTITITNGSVSDVEINIDSNDKTIVKSEKGELIYQTTICTLASDSEKTGTEKGAKYLCKVDPNKEAYTFYVLSDGANGTYNLIMDSNINSSGEAITSNEMSSNGVVSWLNESHYFEAGGEVFENWDGAQYGPITAMRYLDSATSSWSNLKNLNITHTDEGGKFTNFPITGKARLPYKKEINEAGCSDNDTGNCPLWLIGYSNYNPEIYGYNSYLDGGLNGYWTFSSADNSSNVWFVSGEGCVSKNNYAYTGFAGGSLKAIGVRPVINVKL